MNSSFLKIVGLFLVLLTVIYLTSISIFKDFGSGSKEDIEKIVAEYIQNNPQAIIDSVTKYQQRSMEEEGKKAQIAIKEKQNEVENDPTSPVAGNPKGDVVVAEFFDYSCGYCKKVLPSVVKLLEEDKNIKFVFKELPILGPNSELATRAALAVHNIAPDKYFEFHKKLMDIRINGQDSINSIAKEMGIDIKIMEEKMTSAEVEKTIGTNKQLASSIGVHGTPAFVIGGTLVPGAVDYDTLKSIITKARGGK